MIAFDIQKELDGPSGKMLLDVHLRIRQGQFVTLYGPSGAGKTSLLRILAGLLTPDQGSLSVHNQKWYDSTRRINRKPQERRIGYVFQDYALFPNMSVINNLRYAAGRTTDTITQVMAMMELENLQDRKPQTLSGGQQQRVALARAIVQRPDILLLDEPLSALDYNIRLKLQSYLSTIHKELQLTTILVSHDIGEIYKLSDVVYHIEEGTVIRHGSPQEVFANQNVSGKFKFTGEILAIDPEDVIYVVTVLIQNKIVKVVAQESEIENLHVGATVMIASKAFNPIIYPLG